MKAVQVVERLLNLCMHVCACAMGAQSMQQAFAVAAGLPVVDYIYVTLTAQARAGMTEGVDSVDCSSITNRQSRAIVFYYVDG